jgi:hypothetical protein
MGINRLQNGVAIRVGNDVILNLTRLQSPAQGDDRPLIETGADDEAGGIWRDLGLWHSDYS